MKGNLCSRCGKERIFIRLWKEKINNSVITTTENACPDKECQKIVEKDNKKSIERLRQSQLKRKMNSRNKHKNNIIKK